MKTIASDDKERDDGTGGQQTIHCCRAGCDFSAPTIDAVDEHSDEAHGYTTDNYDVFCANCGEVVTKKAFEIKRAERSVCDKECRHELHSTLQSERSHNEVERVTTECSNCGTTIERRPAELEKVNAAYCSPECYRERGVRKGPEHPLWEGGTVSTTLREATTPGVRWGTVAGHVRYLAGDECKMCGENPPRKNAAHHVIPIMAGGVGTPELLMALCSSCHWKAERYSTTFAPRIIADFARAELE